MGEHPQPTPEPSARRELLREEGARLVLLWGRGEREAVLRALDDLSGLSAAYVALLLGTQSGFTAAVISKLDQEASER